MHWYSRTMDGSESLPWVLVESDSLVVSAGPMAIARHYRDLPRVRVAFVDDSHGRRYWTALGPDVVAVLDAAWRQRPLDEAREAIRSRRAKDPALLDRRGRPDRALVNDISDDDIRAELEAQTTPPPAGA